MESEIRTYQYANGVITKAQVFYLDDFGQLDFLHPSYNSDCFKQVCDLYQNYIVKKYGMVYGTIVLFTLPQDCPIPFEKDKQKAGILYNNLAIVKATFEKGLKLQKGEILFNDPKVEEFYHRLQISGYLRVAQGKRNTLTILPIGYSLGFLSSSKEKLAVNANFFTMDCLDCDSPYDEIGTPIGLCVKEGKVIQPPLYNREVLAVNQQKEVEIFQMNVDQLAIEIDQQIYRDKINCEIYSRPDYRKTPKSGMDWIIINNQVVAQKQGGNSIVPSSGFVLHFKENPPQLKNRNVSYHGLENYKFALQVGNSVLVNGKPTGKFISHFYNYLQPWTVSCPPSLYPLDYRKAKAPRIILGNDKENKPVLIWIEGAGKFGYHKGIDSSGASLSQCEKICQDIGLVNAIHLDGGGSAQILLNGQRSLKISDRDPQDFSERERAVPMGLSVK